MPAVYHALDGKCLLPHVPMHEVGWRQVLQDNIHVNPAGMLDVDGPTLPIEACAN